MNFSFKKTIKKFRFHLLTLYTMIIAFTPMTKPERSLTPGDISKKLSFSPLEPINVPTSQDFQIAIQADPIFFKNELTFHELTSIKQEDIKAYFHETLKKRPYLAIRSIAINMATYNRSNNCKIRLNLGNQYQSNWQDCKHLEDNTKNTFHFNDPIIPGIYSAKIEWQPGNEPNNVAIYAQKSKYSDHWLEGFSGRSTTNFVLVMIDWMNLHPILVLIYLVCVIACIWGVIKIPSYQNLSIYILFLFSILGTLVITKFYAGHDETSHIDQVHKSFVSDKLERKDFHSQMRLSMIDHDFFRLHPAKIQKPQDCPHKVLAGCGYKSGPQKLYRFYAPIIETLNWNYLRSSPETITWLIRGINGLGLLICLALVFAIWGKAKLESLLIVVILCGSYLSQVPSVSNDTPMYLVSFFGIASLAGIMEDQHKKKALLSLILCGLFYFLTKDLDPSSLSLIPWLVFACFYFFMSLIKNTFFSHDQAPNQTFQFLDKQSFRYAAIVVGTIILSLTFLRNLPEILKLFGLTLNDFYQYFPKQKRLLSNIFRYGLIESIQAFWAHLKSLIGSFVWGHSYYQWWIYGLHLVFLLRMSYFGLNYLIGFIKGGRNSKIGVCFITGLLLASYLTLVLITNSHGSNPTDVTRESFVKARFLAPGLVPVYILFYMGIHSMLKEKKYRQKIITLTGIWTLTYLIYFLPRFFLADTY